MYCLEAIGDDPIAAPPGEATAGELWVNGLDNEVDERGVPV